MASSKYIKYGNLKQIREKEEEITHFKLFGDIYGFTFYVDECYTDLN